MFLLGLLLLQVNKLKNYILEQYPTGKQQPISEPMRPLRITPLLQWFSDMRAKS